MRNILVPVGSVENAVTNLKFAIHLAAMHGGGSKVYLINLYKEFSRVAGLTKVNELIIEDSQEQLDEVLKQVDTRGVEVIDKPVKGDVVEGINRIAEQLGIDLIILSPQSIQMDNDIYLGGVTGKLVKQTETPILIVPSGYLFRKIETILVAFKRGNVEKENVLAPLKTIARLFRSKVNLLYVKTPDSRKDKQEIDPELKALENNLTVTENATIYQGVLEHFQSNQPDMLVVFRRKRGFFQKLLEKNSVQKKEFYTTKPLLILRGLE